MFTLGKEHVQTMQATVITVRGKLDYQDLVYLAPRLFGQTLTDSSSSALACMHRGLGRLAFGGVVIID